MNILKKGVIVGGVLLFGAAACADLDVDNLNAPDAERALVTPGDVESLVAGAFKQWWTGNAYYEGPSFFLSAAAFQHSAWPANAGVVHYSQFPRPPITNDPADQYYGNVSRVWDRSYRALAALQQGIAAIEEDPAAFAAAFTDGEERLARARAYAKFTQGVAHGSIALLYDRGFVIDETVEVDPQGNIVDPEFAEPRPYDQLMDNALAYFDEAIALAEANEFIIPGDWLGGFDVDQDKLKGIAHAYKARLRAAVARTPAERAAVDWNAVLADLDEATTWDVYHGDGQYSQWTQDPWWYFRFAGWQQLSYWILGMADQSGTYQQWVNVPIAERIPEVNGEPFLIITPDQRFSQGATLEEQTADSEDRYPRYGIPTTFSLANNFQQPARGTWRWSYYWTYDVLNERLEGNPGTREEVSQAELDLLRAEALYRLAGNAPTPEAILLVDTYRTAAGLGSSAANTDCVPRLPDGSCGDFFEMLKWEKRIETQYRGLHGAPWYFEGRGWGDLYEGTYLQFPIPCRDLFVMQMLPCYTFGGVGGEMASPGSVYNWPTEG